MAFFSTALAVGGAHTSTQFPSNIVYVVCQFALILSKNQDDVLIDLTFVHADLSEISREFFKIFVVPFETFVGTFAANRGVQALLNGRKRAFVLRHRRGSHGTPRNFPPCHERDHRLHALRLCEFSLIKIRIKAPNPADSEVASGLRGRISTRRAICLARQAEETAKAAPVNPTKEPSS
jgi:hypothetical protein